MTIYFAMAIMKLFYYNINTYFDSIFWFMIFQVMIESLLMLTSVLSQ